MSGISQSAFLQALGWATLNSFWQVGLLWCLFLGADSLFRFSAQRRYLLSVSAVVMGFLLFGGSFLYYLQTGTVNKLPFFNPGNGRVNDWLPIILTSASVAYLLLLLVPTYRLYRNWRFVTILRKQGLQKIPVDCKLYVQRIATQLGIKKKVQVYLSQIIKSPVTIGYLKPVILLPVASLNQLTVQQAEAVLLHELSHIRRHDYLINILLSIIHTFLYFNPFVKLFLRSAEAAREECCDQMVLQFGYDKIGYASALLSLEKLSYQTPDFVLGAAGKKHLLERIEKIVGVPGKKQFLSFNHVTGFVAALLCIFALHSFFVSSQFKAEEALSFNDFTNPFAIVSNAMESKPRSYAVVEQSEKREPVTKPVDEPVVRVEDPEPVLPEPYALVPGNPVVSDPAIIPVALTEADAHLNAEQEQQVEIAVNTTKKVLTTLEWSKIEQSIADGMTAREKEAARLQYLQEVEQINWENIANNLKVNYQEMDWNKINGYLEQASTSIKLDSLEKTYTSILKKLESAECSAKARTLPLPDCTAEQVRQQKLELRKVVDSLKTIRTNKIIRL